MGMIFAGRLEPNVTVGGCIDIFENAWPEPEETIKLLEEACSDPENDLAWERAGTIDKGIHQNVRTNYHMGLTYHAQLGNHVAQAVHNQMYMLLLASLASYKERYDIHENLYHEAYGALRYRGGQEYKAHYDGGTGTKRSVSAIVYLNNDYEGGHIEFTNYKVKIKPEPGMLILFPSNYAYTHIAHPVTSGTKYAIVTWMTDRE
jgi:predicted 2-oxoglutarate/Fe(II)-dependent dioxygenase YbiX